MFAITWFALEPPLLPVYSLVQVYSPPPTAESESPPAGN
jgi:hypothetical protein